MSETRATKRPFIYWALADNTLPDWQSGGQQSQRKMRSLLKHTLLFNVADQKIVIADSLVLNNRTFRLLARSDPDVRAFIQSPLFAVAQRTDKDGKLSDSETLIEDFKRDGKYLVDFEEGPEIPAIWAQAEIHPYNEREVGERYATTTLDIFRGQEAEKILGKRLAETIVGLALAERARRINEGLELGRIFFYQELSKLIDQNQWQRHKDNIHQLSTAAYQTNLPTLLNADPVFDASHARAFEIVRGIRSRKPDFVDRFDFSGLLGLAALEKGIDMLPFERIWSLMESDEAIAFVRARDEFTMDDQAIVRLREALASYVYRIEQAIIDEFTGLKYESTEGNGRRIIISNEQWIKLGDKAADLVGIFLDHVGIASTILNRLVLDRYFDRKEAERAKSLRREYEQHQQAAGLLRDSLERTGNAQKFTQELKRSAFVPPASPQPILFDEIEVCYGK